MVIRVFKGYVFKGDFSFYVVKGYGSFFVKDIYVCVHKFGEAFDSCHSALELFGEFDNAADGCQKGCYVHGICHEIRGGNQAFYHEYASGHNHYYVHEAVEDADGVLEGGHIFVGFTFYFQEFLIVLIEFSEFHVFVGEGSDYLVAQKAVFNSGIQFADVVSLAFECFSHLEVEIGAGYGHYGNENKNDDSQ